jgi:hypothetical protein
MTRLIWEPLPEPEFGFKLDMRAIVDRMVGMEEDATREAVIAWLRQNGYRVEKEKDNGS